MKRFVAFVIFVAAAASLAACRSSGTAYNPPGSLATRATLIAALEGANGTVVTFPANGNATPLQTISGGSTDLNNLWGIAVNN